MTLISKGVYPEIDSDTGGLASIEVEHLLIHTGYRYYTDFTDSIMADTDVIEILFVPALNNIEVHAIIGCGVTGLGTLEFFEDCTTTDDGAALVEQNRNRLKDNIATLVVTSAPTITVDGTLLQTMYAGSAGKFSVSGGDIRGVSEWILRKNIKYALRLTAHDDIKGRLYINWYEVEEH